MMTDACCALVNDRLQERPGRPIPSDIRVCMVLGAKVNADYTLTAILRLRMELVRILAREYPDWIFCLSGCMEDTSVMLRTLIEEYAIPKQRLLTDFTGHNTFCSIFNMRARFSISRFFILTSTFHLPRAMRIARWLGMEAWGIDISAYEKVKTNPYLWRERLSTVKSLMLCFLAKTPWHRIRRSLKYAFWRFSHRLLWCGMERRNERRMRRMMPATAPTEPLTIYFFLQQMPAKPRGFCDMFEEKQMEVSFSRLDCTTVMENTLALALCYRSGRTDYSDFLDFYRRMHYKGGVVSYATRNHYFTWLMQSAIDEGFVERIGPDKPSFPFTGLMDLEPNFMSRNRDVYLPLARKENLAAIRRRELERVRYTYIPRDLLNMPQSSALGVIRDGDILAITVCQNSWAQGLETKHIFLAKWIGGRLHAYHYDFQPDGRIPVNVYDYLRGKLTMYGVAVYRLRDDRTIS